jgi:hypothetical protein
LGPQGKNVKIFNKMQIYFKQGALRKRRWDPSTTSRLPRSWPENRLNNVAIAVAHGHNAVALFDDQGRVTIQLQG